MEGQAAGCDSGAPESSAGAGRKISAVPWVAAHHLCTYLCSDSQTPTGCGAAPRPPQPPAQSCAHTHTHAPRQPSRRPGRSKVGGPPAGDALSGNRQKHTHTHTHTPPPPPPPPGSAAAPPSLLADGCQVLLRLLHHQLCIHLPALALQAAAGGGAAGVTPAAAAAARRTRGAGSYALVSAPPG